jgi:hypothetical protein
VGDGRIVLVFLTAAAAFIAVASFVPTSLHAAVVVNDSWADGGRDNGPDPLDSNWWTSSNANGIEVSTGSLGMVSGSQGRGIHTVFPTQTLGVGDSLKATYTFTTPATVGTAGAGAFRVGIFDRLGRAGLDGDIVSSSAAPSSLYGYFATNTVGLPGYMMDMDVGTTTEDLSFRQLDTPVTASTPTGRLMGTTTGFTQINPTGPDGAYTFAPNTTYTGSLMLTRLDETTMEITGTLGAASHTVTDTFDSTSYGMLAFWANSSIFGTSPTPNTPDNGIDFSNVRIEYNAVPEPGALAGMALGLMAMARRRR